MHVTVPFDASYIVKGVIAVQKGASVHLFAGFSRFLDQDNKRK